MKNEVLDQAIVVLKHGGVVVFPTDTVWGVGASIEHLEGIRKLYEVKRREPTKPTAVLISDLIMAKRYGEFSFETEELVLRFWPGGLTVVVPAKAHSVPPIITGESEAVGLRAPNHPFVLSLLQQMDCGLVASSANFSGKTAPTRFGEIEQDFLGEVDYSVGGDQSTIEGEPVFESLGQIPSTVVDATSETFRVIREGAVIITP